jgi:hypothetical protein
MGWLGAGIAHQPQPQVITDTLRDWVTIHDTQVWYQYGSFVRSTPDSVRYIRNSFLTMPLCDMSGLGGLFDIWRLDTS